MKCSSGGAIEEDRVDREDGWESNHPASHSPVGSPREVPDDFTQFYGNFMVIFTLDFEITSMNLRIWLGSAKRPEICDQFAETWRTRRDLGNFYCNLTKCRCVAPEIHRYH